MRLLLAEDDASLAALLVEVLTGEGFGVAHAPTRAAALHLAAAEPWTILVTDSFGRSATRPDPADVAYLRALSVHAPVVLLTAHSWARGISPAELGVAAIVAKPFDLAQLLHVLRSI